MNLEGITADIKKNKATHKIVILCGEDHTPCGFLGSMAASEQSMYKMCAKPLFIQSGKQIALVQCLENAGIKSKKIILSGEGDLASSDRTPIFADLGIKSYDDLKRGVFIKAPSSVTLAMRRGGYPSASMNPKDLNPAYAADIIKKFSENPSAEAMLFTVGSFHLLRDTIEQALIVMGPTRQMNFHVIKVYAEPKNGAFDGAMQHIGQFPQAMKSAIFGNPSVSLEIMKNAFKQLRLNHRLMGDNLYFDNLCRKVIFDTIRMGSMKIPGMRMLPKRMELFAMPGCSEKVKIGGLKSESAKSLNGKTGQIVSVKNNTPFDGYNRFQVKIGDVMKSLKPMNLQLLIDDDKEKGEGPPTTEELYKEALDENSPLSLSGGRKRQSRRRKSRKTRKFRRKSRKRRKSRRKKTRKRKSKKKKRR